MVSDQIYRKRVTAVLGPTNTGKTHYAIERLLCHSSGVIGLPLRLLAREVYEKVLARCGKQTVALVTGEERVVPRDPKYWICTVEAMPIHMDFEFLAVDEIQMCSDLDRGHIFTQRLLQARGTRETVFLGSESIKSLIKSILPDVELIAKKRLSSLSYIDSRKLNKVPPRSAVVCFSVDEVYAIAELIRREKGGAAIVTGGLSPRTRNSQVKVYQEGDVDYLVATDAIGMGLNLDIRNVAFASLSKFDGFIHRDLFPNELSQIAGRAGRYTSNGTFGVTAGCQNLNPDTSYRIENHIFTNIQKLQWRNAILSFDDLPCLIDSLNQKSSQPYLIKARENIDQRALTVLSEDKLINERVKSTHEVKLLWKICQIPDYRKISLSDHVHTLQEIFFHLSDLGHLPEEWLEKKIVTLDKYDGGIDGLSKRLAHIRTWNYVANRGDWLENPQSLREKSKEIEDKLSDSLHGLLIERFVDRRTSILMRRLREKVTLTTDLNEKGELFVEDQLIGKLEGLTFVLDPSGSSNEKKTLLAASRQAIKSQISILVDQLYSSPNSDFSINNKGKVMWRNNVVGLIRVGNSMLEPSIEQLLDESAGTGVKEKLFRRLKYFLEGTIKENLDPLFSLLNDKGISGASAGLVFRLGEGLGVLPREAVREEIKALDQDSRGKFRKHGVRFGQYTIFQPSLLKPEPTRIRILLWQIFNSSYAMQEPPIPGLVTISSVKGIDPNFYTVAGFRLLGSRAIRIDMLERLADLVRSKDSKIGFEATPEMLSITGLSLVQFKDLLAALGYQALTLKRTVAAENDKSDQNVASLNIKIKSHDQTGEETEIVDGQEKEYFIFKLVAKTRERKKVSKKDSTEMSMKLKSDRLKKKTFKGEGSKHSSRNLQSRKKFKDPDSPFAALASLIKH